MKEILLFVYNADSDLFSAVTDFAHKILSPSTYQCGLCSLTYGNFSEKGEWRRFVERLPVETTFLYKDEFANQYKTAANLPAIFLRRNDKLEELINRNEIDSCNTLKELQDLVNDKLEKNVQHHRSNL